MCQGRQAADRVFVFCRPCLSHAHCARLVCWIHISAPPPPPTGMRNNSDVNSSAGKIVPEQDFAVPSGCRCFPSLTGQQPCVYATSNQFSDSGPPCPRLHHGVVSAGRVLDLLLSGTFHSAATTVMQQHTATAISKTRAFCLRYIRLVGANRVIQRSRHCALRGRSHWTSA